LFGVACDTPVKAASSAAQRVQQRVGSGRRRSVSNRNSTAASLSIVRRILFCFRYDIRVCMYELFDEGDLERKQQFAFCVWI
jgi:hypothetical protein